MKNYFLSVAVLLAATLAFTCCLDEDTVSSPECAISAFEVDDIETTFTIEASDGTDSTYTRTIDGDEVYFNIDQVRNRICAVDSLPEWVDLSKIIPTITADGYIYYRESGDSLYQYLNNGSDSVDFSNPVEFLVIGYDGISTKNYTAEIYKSEYDEDSLIWTSIITTNLSVDGYHHPIVYDNRIYVFAKTSNGTTVTSSSLNSEGVTWTTPTVVTGAEGDIDYNSVVVFGDTVYALDSNGYIYKSSSDNLCRTWVLASDKKFEKLLAADDFYIYAYDGTAIYESTDLVTWTANGDDELEYLPTEYLSHVSYTSKTNSSMRAVTILGLSDNENNNAVAWYKISSKDESSNQEWGYMNAELGSEYVCPKLDGLNMVRYDQRLFAIGGKDLNDDTSTPYEGIYTSHDNGITWRLQTENVVLPEDVIGENVPTTLTFDGEYLWLIQSGGNLWRGKISGANND